MYNIKTASAEPSFRYYDVMAVLMVVLAMVANIISYKVVEIGPFTVRMGVFISAGMYITADIMTEVYGFARARRTVWLILASLALMYALFKAAVVWPGAAEWSNQNEFDAICDRHLITIAASLVSMFFGMMSNAMIMSRMKTVLHGDMFWLRAVTSSFVGLGFSSVLYYSFAHVDGVTAQNVIPAIMASWFLRLCYEILALPISSSIVTMMKKIEGVDYFDDKTTLNPFRFSLAKTK